MGNAMCRQTSVATYLTLNALHDNAQPFISRLLLLSAIFSIEKWSFFIVK